jgi:hypothetical protein
VFALAATARRERKGKEMKIRMNRRGTSVAAVLVGGALVAGCGGSGDSSTTAPLSQSEFVAKATAICVPASAQIEGAAHRIVGTAKPTAQDFEQLVNSAVVPITQQQIDKFRELTPPADKANTYAQMLDEMQSKNDSLKANPQLLSQSGNYFAAVQRLAGQLGLAACAKQ